MGAIADFHTVVFFRFSTLTCVWQVFLFLLPNRSDMKKQFPVAVVEGKNLKANSDNSVYFFFYYSLVVSLLFSGAIERSTSSDSHHFYPNNIPYEKYTERLLLYKKKKVTAEKAGR